MAGQTREIKRRIKSVANSKKITKAMELVSSIKMRKAVKAVLETRAYARSAWEIITELSKRTDQERHPLLKAPAQVKKVGLIVIASNRGLVGSFNRNVVDTVADYMRKHKEESVDVEAEVFLLGKRGRDVMYKHGHEVIAEFTKLDVATRISEVTALAKEAIDQYLHGDHDKIVIAYTDYYSAIKQVPRIRQLLPIISDDTDLGHIKGETVEPSEDNAFAEYLFEPNPDVVLDQMLYRLIELQIYQALLESNASEHSSRMMAMRNASDNAESYIEDLTLTFNQARQSAITAELADISAGRAAVE